MSPACQCTFLPLATPTLDFIPLIEEKLTFTDGQFQGDSVCAEIMIVSDVFVETKETFEVLLIPDQDDLFAAFIQTGKDKGTVIISDGEENRSKFVFHIVRIDYLI